MTMKLSEAIRLGSTLSPQGMGMYEDGEGRRCALGSALAAIGESALSDGIDNISIDNLISIHWPHVDDLLYDGISMCPDDCGATCSELGCLIVHLNDEHGWSREQIADYIAQFDPAEVREPQNVHSDGGPGPGVLSLEVTAS